MTDPTPPPAPVRASALFLVGAIVCFVLPPLTLGLLVQGSPPPLALVAVALVELASAGALVAWWLRRRSLSPADVGLTSRHWFRDALLGAATVPPRLLIEFGVLIPMAGGAHNPEVQEVLTNASAGVAALAATLVLGVVGGGLAEELYFRGFLMGALPKAFVHRRAALYGAAAVSVLLFAALHLPTSAPDVAAIVLASLVYTALFLLTRRLTATVVAHSLWNATTLLTVVAVYG
ncbi:CPBP family intramembrane metalloprotease [Nocardiopsis sp. EMB25]|uniref:CPBP family intramembrane glutamic endopeptidase n=1 Tax=Nocardiopsis TaxID=2013 RepID=UPI0003492DF4|nr:MULTISPECIES: type II CAAX endopeptidase family protein [Nocardiopsis]MCY9784230.1 CPBP family intramembrane metalloprotease [Nocardiopsis sp. EMB25]